MFFYIVRCKDGTLYSGITVNVVERLKKHNKGTGAKYTAAHRPSRWFIPKMRYRLHRHETRKTGQTVTENQKERLARSAVKMDTKVKEYIDSKNRRKRKSACNCGSLSWKRTRLPKKK